MKKRLEDVIEAMEHCMKPMPESLCSSCPTGEKADKCGVYAAALQFLKIFQQSKDELHALIEDYRKEIQTKEDQRNPALTWDELTELSGCPVWVKADHAFIQYTGWVLADQIDDSCNCRGMIFTCPDRSEFFLMEDFIGTTWSAYRKERKQ